MRDTYYKIPDTVKVLFESDGKRCLLLNLGDNTWMGFGGRIGRLIQRCDGSRSLGEIVEENAGEDGVVKERLYGLFADLKETGYIVSSSSKESQVPCDPVAIEQCYFFVAGSLCNLECLHCAGDSGPGARDLLSTTQALQVIDKISELGPEQIVFSGGEPLCRTDMVQLLDHASSVYEGTMCLSTNATLINEEIARSLKRMGVKVDVSLDGFDEESCAVIRGKGTFAKAMQGIAHLRSVGFGRINVSFVLTRQNIDQGKRIVELGEREGLDVAFRSFEPTGRGKRYRTLLEPTKQQKERHRESDYKNKTGKVFRPKEMCNAGINTVAIAGDGLVYPCIQLVGRSEFRMGSALGDQSLKEMIAWFHRKGVLSRYRIDRLSTCQDCDVRYFCQESKCIARLSPERVHALFEQCQWIRGWLRPMVWSSQPDLSLFGLTKINLTKSTQRRIPSCSHAAGGF